MAGFPSPFSAPETASGGTEGFDPYDRFVPAHLPEPGPFLDEQTVLTGRDHAAFHRLTKQVFDDRSVYDVTFGYNLARLNVDRRHPSAGYRYAVESPSEDADRTPAARAEDANPTILRAEFTPTTPFCPQSKSLTVGSFRAWNGETDRHEYEAVRVRVHPMHHRSDAINEKLAALESERFDLTMSSAGSDCKDETDHASLVREHLDVDGSVDEELRETDEPTDGVDLSEPF